MQNFSHLVQGDIFSNLGLNERGWKYVRF